jgi:hypothetical protein
MKRILATPELSADFLLNYIGLVLENYEKEVMPRRQTPHVCWH